MNDQNSEIRSFWVGPVDVGKRLDRFLTEQCPDLSRNQIQRALAERQVEVSGRIRPKSHRLAEHDRVDFKPLPHVEPLATPQDIPLNIVFQDEDILVVNKQAGLVVHPAPGHPDGTLVNALLFHCRELAPGGHPLRPGIVHRLDMDTTGLLVVALNDIAHRGLVAQLQERTMRRTYLALSWGCWPESSGRLRSAVARHPRDRLRMAVVSTGGREAVTEYEVREDFGFMQLCRISLETGRTHQIRVQFAEQSHPVLGDPTYGDDRRGKNVLPVDRNLADQVVKLAQRQMLHATELSLLHPRRAEEMTFQTEPPADMRQVLDLLRAAR
ncbi:MAG: RluA family pseudouridine synthase [bacterium]